MIDVVDLNETLHLLLPCMGCVFITVGDDGDNSPVTFSAVWKTNSAGLMTSHM